MKQSTEERATWAGQVITNYEAQIDTTTAEKADLGATTPTLSTVPIEPAGGQLVKAYVAIFAAVLMVVTGSWILGSVYLTKIAVGSIRVPAHDNDQALSALLSKQVAAYRLGISYPDGKEKNYSLQQLGLSLDEQTSVSATRIQQHQLSHRILWWKPIPATVVLDKNEVAFNNFIASAVNVTVQPTKDAALIITNGNIRVTDAVAGKQYGLKQPEQTLLTAVSNLRPATIRLQTLKVSPALTAVTLEPYKALLEKTINQPAKFTIGGQTITPSPADIASWLDITPDDKTKKVDITVNSGKAAQYINSIAAAVIHPPRAQVDISQSDGSSKVFIPGVNGVNVLNESAVATSVSSTLLNGPGFNFSLPVSYQPFKTVTTGSYRKWIEVDLTNKRLYVYEYTNLVKTDLMTAGAPATPTVTGQYAIYSKYEQQNMNGENVDGSTYFQPNVPWVNYFYKDYAIHGNYWRPLSYFGNVNSSHGCVGLMDNDAAWVYDWAPIGTPVVIHT